MEPTPAELADGSLSTISGLAAWCGMEAADLKLFGDLTGFSEEQMAQANPRLLVCLPMQEFKDAVANWAPEGTIVPMRLKMLATYLRSTAEAICRPAPPAPATPPAAASTPFMSAQAQQALVDLALDASAKANASKRSVKMSTILDPTDDSEVRAAGPLVIKQWYRNYRQLKYGDPLPEKDPTPDQVSAMNTRVVELGGDPYGDFSILTPFGRRVQKVLKHRGWMLQEDGSYRGIEVPGPGSFDVWQTCWKVYEVILLMLRFPSETGRKPELVVTPIALEAYFENFSSLCKQYPECWYLCQRAEDRCRAEHLGRIARRLETEWGYMPTWSDVFTTAASDNNYWNKEVRDPAVEFIARGHRKLSLTGATEDFIAAQIESGGTNSEAQNDKRKRPVGEKLKPVKAQKQGEKGAATRNTAKGEGRGEHPRKNKDGLYLTNGDGKEICYKFNNKVGCKQGACPAGRAHVCQKCLQPHSKMSQSCPKKNA